MNETILLVDDEPGILKVLGLSLRDRGYTVHTADAGDAALVEFQRHHPPIVITDIKMPGIGGIELLRRIKTLAPDTEVIMITGHGDIDTAIESLKHEAADFITKPISEDALAVALKRSRERIALREQLRRHTENLEELVREKSRQLIAAERLAAVGETVAGLAHTIKSIASGLRGGSFVLEQGIESADPVCLNQGWDMVRTNVEKITRLSMDLLDFAKISEVHMTSVQPNGPPREVVDLLKAGALERGVTLTADLDPDLKPVRMDPEGIHRCLLNLTANAVDAAAGAAETLGGRQVTVQSATVPGWAVAYRVRDNGMGMDETTRNNLFKIFFTTKGSRGTGIGLMTAKKIVDLHHGRLTVETALDAGTTFTLLLP